MIKIINSTYITFDGVAEPHLWPSVGHPRDDRFGQIQTDLALSCDATLRTTAAAAATEEAR